MDFSFFFLVTLHFSFFFPQLFAAKKDARASKFAKVCQKERCHCDCRLGIRRGRFQQHQLDYVFIVISCKDKKEEGFEGKKKDQKAKNRKNLPRDMETRKGLAGTQPKGWNGLFCVCYRNREDAEVIASGGRVNALRLPTTLYNINRMKDHASHPSHTRALFIESVRSAQTVQSVAVRLPAVYIPQMKVLFRLVYSLAKRGMGHSQIKDEIALFQANGGTYSIGYQQRRYVPVVLQFLAGTVRSEVSRDFRLSIFRHLMADEVKVGVDEYLTIAVRCFAAGSFCTSGLAVQKSTKRDASSIVGEFDSAMNDLGIDPSIWLSSSTIGCTFDGAKVLLGSVSQQLQQKRSTESNSTCRLYTLYCCSHRIQRVDSDATTTADCIKLCKQLHSLLSRIASFFSRSTKRWQELKVEGRKAGFTTQQGRQKQRRLLRYASYQKNRYVNWKYKAVFIFLNNYEALFPYLKKLKDDTTQTQHVRRKAKGFFERISQVRILYALMLYKHYSRVLARFSLCTQDVSAVLPTLSKSIAFVLKQLEEPPDGKDFVDAVDWNSMEYRGCTIKGSKDDIADVDKWLSCLLAASKTSQQGEADR